MMPGTLARYFGFRFLSVFVVVFGGLFLLVLMVDIVEMLRRTSDVKDVSALLVAKISIYRVPFVTERVIPFAVLVGAMVCYLSLSRRLELVVARSAGVSAWQFIRPAVVIALLIGIAITTLYNPISAMLREQSERMEAELIGNRRDLHTTASGFWLRQRSDGGQSIINAATSMQQGAVLSNVTILTFDNADRYRTRIEAKRATLHDGFWRLEGARVYSDDAPPTEQEFYDLKTSLTRAQVQIVCDTGKRAVLAPDVVHQARRKPGLGRDRLPAAILPTADGAVLLGCDGAACRCREPSAVPLRRRSEDGIERYRCRVRAVRDVQGHG